MNSECQKKNPLVRSGISRFERTLEALKPEFVQIDERDIADIILFAKKYAAYLKYYDVKNSEDGDWTSLMSKDVTVTLATIFKTDIEGSFTFLSGILKVINYTSNTDEARKYFKLLFDFGFTIAKRLDEHYKSIPLDLEFKEFLEASIKSNLPEYHQRLNSFYEAALSNNLIDSIENFRTGDEPFSLISSSDFDESQLSEIWQLPTVSFSPSINGSSILLKIKNICSHNLFTGIYDEFLKTYSGIISSSGKALGEIVGVYPKHSPHYALFLTFVKLFRYSQDHLNEYTKRHLNLYYKDILKLHNKKAEQDEVHLVFELQKNIQEHKLVKGTAFKAGKDNDKIDIFYALKEDIVINKGKVKSIKNLFVKRDELEEKVHIFACPVANSEDGIGEKLRSADKCWNAFGNPELSPRAKTGFLIASPYLLLREGERKISFRFFAEEGDKIHFTKEDLCGLFEIQLSGENGWIDVSKSELEIRVDGSKDYFEINIDLDAGKDAVVPYSKDIHQHNFATEKPAAKFILANSSVFKEVLSFSFSKISISTEVKGMKNLKVINGISTIDPVKPFEMFGPSPHAGSSLIIGCKELFVKTLDPKGKLISSVAFEWDDKSSVLWNNKVTIKVLEDSNWKSVESGVSLLDYDATLLQETTQKFGKLEIETSDYLISEQKYSTKANTKNEFNLSDGFGTKKTTKDFQQLNFELDRMKVSEDYTADEDYSARSKWGYFRINSDNNFNISDNNKAPKIKELSLDYTASTIHNFKKSEGSSFIHITPFGSKSIRGKGSAISLLPDFENEGELFIGIDQFAGDQTIAILFRVSEGSADPLLRKEDIIWSYLAKNNKWTNLNREDIADSTSDLTKSGIIKFSVPVTAVAENTLMTDQLIWLKGALKENTGAVCKLIDVLAQSATAEFADIKTNGNFYKNVLPANSISKPVNSDASVKKISQPYASINGKQDETDEVFYTRVSERLRHKNRGVAMWDYERIVLENFPQIYKVKCINHTQIVEKKTGGVKKFQENGQKPGFVLLIPIPDVRDQKSYDPLRPLTSLGLLEDIKKHLYKVITPHAELDVRNPVFEEVQLDFNVRFVTQDNAFFEKQLRHDIEKFMAPWAFDPCTDIEFGGKISKSSLIDFIEERDYVDVLSCVKMFHIKDGVVSKDVDEAYAGTSRSVFVSVKSDDPLNAHKIKILQDKCEC